MVYRSLLTLEHSFQRTASEGRHNAIKLAQVIDMPGEAVEIRSL